MADDTTTEEVIQPTPGAEDAQPVAAEETPAAEDTTTEPSEPPQGGDDGVESPEQPQPTVDDKLQTYAKSQGLELDSPSAIKAATIAMKNQQEATRNYQRTNELEKATNITDEQIPEDVTPQQSENIRIRKLELKYEASQWKQSNPDKAALEPQMVKLLTDDPNKRLLVQQGYLSYDDLYAIAKGSTDDSATVKSQGAQAALKSLAHKQQAAVPTGNATTMGTPKAKPFADLSISEMEKKLGFVRR